MVLGTTATGWSPGSNQLGDSDQSEIQILVMNVLPRQENPRRQSMGSKSGAGKGFFLIKSMFKPVRTKMSINISKKCLSYSKIQKPRTFSFQSGRILAFEEHRDLSY